MATRLKDKVQHALDEGRMMVLGVQVLIGAGFRAAFEPAFAHLTTVEQSLQLAALGALCASFAVVVAVDADHRIVERGNDTPAFHRLATKLSAAGLLPFALAIGMEFAVAARRVGGVRASVVAGVLALVVPLAAWFGVELWARPPRRVREHVTSEGEDEPTGLHEKIRHVLTEARVVLPGAQALLGFQLSVMFTARFAGLPPPLQWLHFGSLAAIALAVMLLITPASWHRIVERGEETEGFHRLASALVVAALVPLAAGLSGDFYLVALMVTRSPSLAALLTALLAALFCALWGGIGVARRLRGAGQPGSARGPAQPGFGT